jgi:hypothetical protein
MAHERIFKFGATVRIFGRAQLSFSHASSSNLYTDGATKIQAPTRILFGPVYDLICVLPYLSRYPFLEMLLFCLFSSLALLALCLLLSTDLVPRAVKNASTWRLWRQPGRLGFWFPPTADLLRRGVLLAPESVPYSFVLW